jgi:hypothetical protein
MWLIYYVLCKEENEMAAEVKRALVVETDKPII